MNANNLMMQGLILSLESADHSSTSWSTVVQATHVEQYEEALS